METGGDTSKDILTRDGEEDDGRAGEWCSGVP